MALPKFIARRYDTTEANLHKARIKLSKDLVPVLTSPKEFMQTLWTSGKRLKQWVSFVKFL
jgi:hypothetical protein